jgi:peptidoglycan hydrolase-like protein with peptidoglycan-binding domain
MRTLKRGMKGEDVRLLHAVLNWHLPPSSDQLPTSGDGAFDFGPRTENKVREFQKLNRIDIGTKDFMDGIVGPHTAAVLQSGAKIVVRAALDTTELPPVIPRPGILPPPGVLPLPKPLPPPSIIPPPAPQPRIIPVPKLHLDNVQIQAGGSHTFNSTRSDTDTVFFQASYVILWKSQGPHTEISLGLTNLFSVGATKDGDDIQIFGQITRAQIPIFGRLTASFFAQIAGQSLLPLKPFRPVVGIGAGAQIQWEFIKDTLSIGAQGMPFLNVVNERNPDRPGQDRIRFMTGAQGQGFLILQLDVGKRSP